jgi:single-stranded DNA-specific DHH superfamily exonuclease
MVLEAIRDKWKSKMVTGEEPTPKPSLINFYNCNEALYILRKHIKNCSKIAVHCDVDMDGIGSGYIVKRFIEPLISTPMAFVINKEKEHGVSDKHPEFFNKTDIDLMIILDSSSNELEVIKKFNCDVLVVDHHELSINTSELKGKTAGGQYVIVNNMVSNPDNILINQTIKYGNPLSTEYVLPYDADSRMSCGLVIYELLRLYQEVFIKTPYLENMLLYQWSAVTLITDAIQLLTDRNQWYIENTVHSRDTEVTLKIIMNHLNQYIATPDKSFISYTLAPTFNRAIRAGHSLDALNIVIQWPENVEYLKQFRELQDMSVSIGIENAVIKDSYVMRDLSGTEVSKNYTGVIAGRLCDENKKNAVVYNVIDGIAVGSFRGRLNNTDYRSCFINFRDDVYAQGHEAAFGFKVKVADLEPIMQTLTSVESEIDERQYLTAGNIPVDSRGKYHIENMEEFKQAGGLMMLGIGNSRVSSKEQIMISVSSSEATLIEQRGKLYLYSVLGLTCKAFKEIEPGIINIYVESSRSIEFYLK